MLYVLALILTVKVQSVSHFNDFYMKANVHIKFNAVADILQRMKVHFPLKFLANANFLLIWDVS